MDVNLIITLGLLAYAIAITTFVMHLCTMALIDE